MIRVNQIKVFAVVALVVAAAISFIGGYPEYKFNEVMQHVGTALLLIPLVCDSIKNRMPASAFVGFSLFTLLHIVAARYIYSYVPYREWCVSAGVPAEYWGFPAGYERGLGDFFEEFDIVFRNHFDRLIHFSFGFLMFPYLMYLARKLTGGKTLAAVLVAWLFVQAGSLIYEVFEWQISAYNGNIGDAYNGQQGDMWDAQKDMFLAMLGSTLMAVYYAIEGGFERKAGFTVAYAVVMLLCGCIAWFAFGGMRCSYEDGVKQLRSIAERKHNVTEKIERKYKKLSTYGASSTE